MKLHAQISENIFTDTDEHSHLHSKSSRLARFGEFFPVSGHSAGKIHPLSELPHFCF